VALGCTGTPLGTHGKNPKIPFKLCPYITNIPCLIWPLRGRTQKGEGINYQLGGGVLVHPGSQGEHQASTPVRVSELWDEPWMDGF